MIWPFNRTKHLCEETQAALAAKMEARLELNNAKATYREITKQTEELEEINKRNHFSESLTLAFRRSPS